MELQSVTPAQESLILKLFELSPTYFLNIDGCLPTRHTVRDALLSRPAKTQDSYRKEFLLIRHEGEIIAGVELHADHPEPHMAYIGLLLVREDKHGQHLGRACYDLVEDYVRRRYNCRRIRLGVSDENDVSGFWSKMGYSANGRNYSWTGERKVTNVVEYEKALEA